MSKVGSTHEHGDDDAMETETALRKIERYFWRSNRFKAQVGTTIATDLIGGGIKSNALPEEAWAVVNHRISDRRFEISFSYSIRVKADFSDSSVKKVEDHWREVLAPVAKKYNLSFDPFSEASTSMSSLPSAPESKISSSTTTSKTNSKAVRHILRLSDAYGTALNPSPISPSFGDQIWDIFAGTIKSSIQNARRRSGADFAKSVIVAPSLSLGNTGMCLRIWDTSSVLP